MHDQVLPPSRRRLLLASGLTACASLLPGQANASHHFESAAVRANPKLGLTDLYVFDAPGADRTVFILDVNFAPRPGEAFLDGAALYSIHCASDDKFVAGRTWSFSQVDGGVACHQGDEANGALGAKGPALGTVPLGKATKLPGGIRVWAGVAKDPFFGNSPGIGAFRAQLAQGKYDPEVWAKAAGTNIFSGRSCGVLVLEMPNALLGKRIGVFSTVAVQQDGSWRQVQYMAKALISHSMLFEDEALKAAFNASRPDTQEAFVSFFAARIARAAHFAGSRKDAFAYGDRTARRLLPDVVAYEVGTKASLRPERVNGRRLGDDAMTTTLTWLIGQPTDQKVKDPGNHTAVFPFVVPA